MCCLWSWWQNLLAVLAGLAVLLGALLIQGVQPGPMMFAERPEEVRQIEDGFRRGQPSPEAYAAQVRALLAHNTTNELAQIRVPTLVVLGAEDIETPMRFARVLAKGIPKAELKVLPRTGHRPHVETPDLFNETVIEFLHQHPLPPSPTQQEDG